MEKSLAKLLQRKGRGVVSTTPEVTVREAANEMSSSKVGALLVMDEAKLVGILTERDFLNRVVAAGRDPELTKVHEVMTADVVVIDPAHSIREAMQIVTAKRLRHLPVVREGELIGMVSSGDLTRSIVAEEEQVIETLYEYIRGSYPV